MKISAQTSQFVGNIDLNTDKDKLEISLWSNELTIMRMLEEFFGTEEPEIIITRNRTLPSVFNLKVK